MITISLDQPAADYRPGEIISGSVAWTGLNDKVSKLETRLIWYTEGKGDQDVEVVASQTTDSNFQEGSTRFQFEAPNRPYSFSGKLISLIWAVEVVLFPARDGERSPISISNQGKEIVLDKSFEESALKAAVRVGK